MLVLRLQRTGKNKEATYKVVVAEKSDPVKKKSLETVGNFIPQRDPVHLVLKQDRIKYWMEKGAKPSDTLARILKKEGMDGMDQYILRYTKQKKRKGDDSETEVSEASNADTEAATPESQPEPEAQKDEPPAEKAEDSSGGDEPAPAEDKPEEKTAEASEESATEEAKKEESNV
ncbi:MAG: 30S ribosomal protein S16 [Candidatus Peribacteraceae bacterium]|jgi:small subunit ribosomal protein S16|nr:30S ribosomal protein S16 [Candidatus Peribacteraceae bacterium]|tara:strand:+ start:667 stop:1188 length:522 start_codon:yes stop_codon:yes gene_type:complete